MSVPADANRKSRFDKIAILAMSAAFLLVIVAFLLLIGTGRVDLGVDPSLAFILYVIAGLMVAFATFGILTSTGELSGSPFGIKAKLGGSVVAAVIVAAGGSLYELYVRPSAFSMRVMFYESTPANPVLLTGSLSLLVGAGIRSESVQSDGTVLFQNLNRKQQYRYILRSPQFEVHASERDTIEVAPDSLVALKVLRKLPFEPYDTSDLILAFDGADVVRAMASDYSVTLRVSAWSKSERPVPLRTTAVLRLTKAGLPFRTFTGDVSGGTGASVILVKESQPETLLVNVLMPSDFADMIEMGFDADLTFKYADPSKAEGGDFGMAPIAFSAMNFPLSR